MLLINVAVANKALLLISATLLVGVAVLPVLVLPSQLVQRHARTLSVLSVVFAALVALTSLFDVYFVLANLGRGVTAELYQRYLFSTRHGTAVQWRLGFAAVAAVLGAFAPTRRPVGLLAILAGLATIGSVSYTSHAAAVGTTFALGTDFVHFAASGLWAGAIIVGVWLPVWRRDHANHLANRISLIGTVGAVAIIATGVISSLFHTEDPARFVQSPYALALVIKIGLAVLVFAVAAYNRFVLMPRIGGLSGSGEFRRGLLLEAVLLLVLLFTTGILTSSEMPHTHDPDNLPTIFENARGLFAHLFGGR